jgi:hypothetical protein
MLPLLCTLLPLVVCYFYYELCYCVLYVTSCGVLPLLCTMLPLIVLCYFYYTLCYSWLYYVISIMHYVMVVLYYLYYALCYRWLYVTSIMHSVTVTTLPLLCTTGCTTLPLLCIMLQLVVCYLYYALCYHWLYVTSIIHSVMLIVVCYLYYTLVLVNVVFVNVSQLLQSCNFGRFCAYELPAYVAFLLGFGVLAGTCTEE